MPTYTETHVMVTTTCASCGIVFGVPEAWDKRRRADGKGFTCPNGHSLTYGETDEDRLKKELEASERKAEQAEARQRHLQDQYDASERSKAALRGELTKTKKRAAAGVCPGCNRSFVQLQRHMSTKHPELAQLKHDECATSQRKMKTTDLPTPTASEVREWARSSGISVSSRGRLTPNLYKQYADAHS
jgi:hypothetical protein